MRGEDFYALRNIVLQHEVLYAIVILVITIILARTLLQLFEGLLKFFSKKSKSFNHKLIAVIERPAVTIIILVGIELAIRNIILSYENLNNFFTTGIIIILTYSLIKVGGLILENWSTKMSHAKGEEFHSEILPLLKSVTSIVLTIIGFIMILQAWNVDIPTVLTSLGVVSVLLGFAFQQTLANIFGGISLIMDNSFRKGDLIQLEDSELGEVLEITLRSTKIKNFDSESIIIPNGQLANQKIINLAQPTPTVRIKIPVNVAYGSDPVFVKEVLHGSLRRHPDILKMPKRIVRFVGLADSSLSFELYFYINDYKKMWDIKDEVLIQVYKDLYKNKIEIPFPIRTLVQAKPKQYGQKWKEEKN